MPVSRAHLCSIELLTQVDEGALKTLNKIDMKGFAFIKCRRHDAS